MIHLFFVFVYIETKHLDNLNFDMKKKLERLSFFDPNDIFNQSEDSFLEDDKINNRSLKLSFENSKSYKHVSSSYVKTSQSKGKYVSQKIKFYKLAIKWLDVISTILIIISMLIAQIENQNFYEKNFERRTTLIKIANYIISKNFSGYNDIEVDKSLNYTNFKNTFDKNEISSLKVDLEIDDISQKLRYTILSLSVISGKYIKINKFIEI